MPNMIELAATLPRSTNAMPKTHVVKNTGFFKISFNYAALVYRAFRP